MSSIFDSARVTSTDPKNPFEDAKVNFAEPSFARKVQYGTQIETNLFGDIWRLGNAAVSAIGPTTFEEERERIEQERIDEVYEQFPEFQFGDYDSDGAVISGRAITMLLDPVLLAMPYGLALKGTSLAMKGAKLATLGAGVGVGDATIRSFARTGEVEPTHLAFAGTVGAAGGPLGFALQKGGGALVNKLFPNLFKNKQQADAVIANLNKQYEKKYNLNQKQLASVSEISELPGINKLFNLLKNELNIFQEALKPRDTILKQLDDIVKNSAKNKNYKLKLKKIKVGKKIFNVERTDADYIKTLKKDISDYFETQTFKLQEAVSNKHSNLQIQIIKELEKRGGLTNQVIRAFTANLTRPGLYGLGGGVFHTMFGDSDDGLLTSAGIGFAAGLTHRALILGKVRGISKLRQGEIAKEYKKGYLNSFVRQLSIYSTTTQQSRLSARGPIHDQFSKLLFYRPKDTVTRDILGNVVDVKGSGAIGAGNSAEDLTNIAFKDFVKGIDDVIGINNVSLLNSARRNQLFKVPLTEAQRKILQTQDEAIDIVRGFKGQTSSEGRAMAERLREWISKYKNYFNEVGISEKEVLDNYFPRKFDYDKINKNKTKFLKTIEEIITTLKKDPTSYYYKKTTSSKVLAQQYFSGVVKDVEDPIVNTGRHTYTKVFNKLPISRHITEVRRLGSQSDDVFNMVDGKLKEYTINDIRTVLTDISRDTTKSVEFARKFGPVGEEFDVNNVIQGYFKRIDDQYKNAGFTKQSDGFYGPRHKADIKAIEDGVNSYFGKFTHGKIGKSHHKEIFAILSTLANFSMMDKVTIANLGDLIQPFQNSRYWDSAIRGMFPVNRVQRAFSKQGIVHSGIVQENLVDAFVTPKGGSARFISDDGKPLSVLNFIGKSNQAFFKLIGLESVTNLARRYAYNVGAVDAHKTSKIISEGFDAGRFQININRNLKLSDIANSNMRESSKRELLRNLQHLNKIGALRLNSKGEIENLADVLKFGRTKNTVTATRDVSSQNIMDNVGMRAADRDAIIPTVGNRLLFAQDKNPMVRILGQFSSWAMAKSAQTNAMIERIEDGSLKQMLALLGATVVYGGIQDLRDFARTGELKYPVEAIEDDPKKWMAEASYLSGNLGWLPTTVLNQIIGYGSSRPLAFAPAMSIVDGILAMGKVGFNSLGFNRQDYDKNLRSALELVPAPTIRRLIDRTFGTNLETLGLLSTSKKAPVNSLFTVTDNLGLTKKDRTLFEDGGLASDGTYNLKENPETTYVSNKKELVKQIADGPKIVPKEKPRPPLTFLFRNNNPGMVKVSSDWKGETFTGSSGEVYKKYPSKDEGLADIINTIKKYNTNNLNKIISIYATDDASGKRAANYENILRKQFNVPNKIDFSNPSHVEALLKGITHVENSTVGQKYNYPVGSYNTYYLQKDYENTLKRLGFFRGGFARARRAMTSNRAYSTNREAYRASQYRQAAKSMQKAGIKNLSGGTSTKSAEKIQEDFRNNNNNNNQTNETPTKTTSILDKAVETATDAVKNPIETGSRIKEKFDDYTQFELLDGDLDINLQKGTVEYDSGFGTFAVEGGGLLSAEPNIQFTFTKEFKKGGLLDKKRG